MKDMKGGIVLGLIFATLISLPFWVHIDNQPSVSPEDKIVVECAEPILWEFSYIASPELPFETSHMDFLTLLASNNIFLFEEKHPFEDFDNYTQFKADYYREFLGWGELPPQNIIETSILNLVNEARIEENLSELIHDPALYEIALDYCKEMYQKDEFTHDGFEDRANLVRSNGYTLIGENLARGYDSPQTLVEDWLQSPTHRENIMQPLFFYTGLACYEGYTCQIFGGYDLVPFIKPISIP